MKLLLLDERFPAERARRFRGRATSRRTTSWRCSRCRLEPVGEELLAQLPALRVVGTASVGFDHIDIEAAERAASRSSAFPDYCTRGGRRPHARAPVCAAAGHRRARSDVARGGWKSKAAGPLRTLAGMRVGIVGLGRIGNAVATRLLALGAEVWANDVLPEPRDDVRFVELERAAGGVRRGHAARAADDGDARPDRTRGDRVHAAGRAAREHVARRRRGRRRGLAGAADRAAGGRRARRAAAGAAADGARSRRT